MALKQLRGTLSSAALRLPPDARGVSPSVVRGERTRSPVAPDTGPVRDPRFGGDAAADAGRARDPALSRVARALADRRSPGGCVPCGRDPGVARARLQPPRTQSAPRSAHRRAAG